MVSRTAWPGIQSDETRTLLRLGNGNYAQIADFIRANQIDCDLGSTGVIWAATEPYFVEAIPKIFALHHKWGQGTIP